MRKTASDQRVAEAIICPVALSRTSSQLRLTSRTSLISKEIKAWQRLIKLWK